MVDTTNKDVWDLVCAVHQDLVKTYGTQLTRDWLMAEANCQLAGMLPKGGPGMFLNGFLIKAGYIGA